ncbi:MAG: hypothetical protein EOS85_11595 [Mesorhizobium sp.]|nr:MAG: hypothetical protein EOS85_11595 [Mesorhizobium sp.]
MPTADLEEDMVREFTAMANARIESGYPSDADEARQVIEDHDLVAGVWQDANERHGVGIRIIKGYPLLRMIVNSRATRPVVKTTALPCREEDEAAAMRLVFGDGVKGSDDMSTVSRLKFQFRFEAAMRDIEAEGRKPTAGEIAERVFPAGKITHPVMLELIQTLLLVYDLEANEIKLFGREETAQ